jgi:hypothetical protein
MPIYVSGRWTPEVPGYTNRVRRFLGVCLPHEPAEEGLNKTFLFVAISDAGDIGWAPNFEMGDGGFRKSALIASWVLVPHIEKFGKSNGRTRDQLTVEREKFYRTEE